MSSTPFAVKWGILATGGIAQTFCQDILTNPATRDVHDVKHIVAAAASSSSKSRAEQFLKDIRNPGEAKAYGSYAELVKDPDVDIIYVATPHSHHFQNVMLALQAGKPVLCEKAFTVNAAQAKILYETAKSKNLFLMEAVWTRYFPLSIKIREMVIAGEIGVVHRVTSDLSINSSKDDGTIDFDDSHRMVNLELAGGALLDLGIYALTWVFQILYNTQPEPRERPQVIGSMQKYDKTGADESTSIILNFPAHKSMGIALTSLRIATDPDGHTAGAAVRIQGTKGEIQVMGPIYRPTHYRIIKKNAGGMVEEIEAPPPTDPARNGDGHGMYWEADEAARCLRDKKLESKTMGWTESTIIMEVMDEVRRQGGLKYGDLIESTEYSAQSLLNIGNQ